MDDLPDAGPRYSLGPSLGCGAFGKVFGAIDKDTPDKQVAIKIVPYNNATKAFIEEEYAVLKDSANCAHLIPFFGMYKNADDIWFVLKKCEGNTALDLTVGLLQRNRRMSEEHMGYILKELIKAIVYLHQNGTVHRDIKASNILLTKEGEVKLCDFGLAQKVSADLNQRVGSYCWIAPEVVAGSCYDNRVDVWGVGITSIELAEGAAPFQGMNPSRALFQIEKNPPPVLARVSCWSEQFHDFISECLVKNFEHRPYMEEVIEHPFLQDVPENNYHLSLEIKALIEQVGVNHLKHRPPEIVVLGSRMKTSTNDQWEKVVVEDLADLDSINEEMVLNVLEERFKLGQYYTFIGDILVSLNPYMKPKIYGTEFHQKYLLKSRSHNAPHIYAVADTAYQNALHHKVNQQIVLTGESSSGKTTNYLHVIDHLFFIGAQHPVNTFRIKNGINLIHALCHASTPTNDYSTRCVLKTNVFFGQTGKLTATSFKAMALEKWRVSAVDMDQSNFHILYYIYDGLVYTDAIQKYKLHSNRDYRYMRIPEDAPANGVKPRDNPEQNIIKYKKIFSYLEEFEFTEEQICTFFSVMAAILNLGEIRFKPDEEHDFATVENVEFVENFCDLMEIEQKSFLWALTNYCVRKKGNVIRKTNTCSEARDARDVLANNLYSHFVDYVVGMINDKLEIGKTIFGSKYSVSLLDFFGFECFQQNHIPQFFVNCFNEQLQYHYLQRVFSWEIQDVRNEELEFEPIAYFDNKKTLDQLLCKPEGVLSIVDDAAKRNLGGRYVTDNLERLESTRVTVTKSTHFSIAHYTGTVSYDAREMPNKNRDFLPPELIETMKESDNPIIRMLFSHKLDKTGNLVLNLDRTRRFRSNRDAKAMEGVHYSQVKNMRTSGMIFRSISLELLKDLSIGGGSGGSHFVRCIRSNLKGKPQQVNKELVKHQVRALAVIETATIRQKGYPHRISFSEFLRRYKFLAFDFDEVVDITKENCRLLLIRLKMEGWAIGNTQVFLKYYNEEYLSRLYETHVRQIVKIQSILRGFLAKCRLNKKARNLKRNSVDLMKPRRRSSVMTEEEAAEVIQKAYRRTTLKHKRLSSEYKPLDEQERRLILPYVKKWKSSSIYYVLLQYRSSKMYEFFNFCQQVHIYNQNTFFQCQKVLKPIDIAYVDQKANPSAWFGEIKTVVTKIKFKLDEIPFYDTSSLCDPLTNVRGSLENERWDTPYQWRARQSNEPTNELNHNSGTQTDLQSIPFTRDPEDTLIALPRYRDQVNASGNYAKSHAFDTSSAKSANLKNEQEPFASISQQNLGQPYRRKAHQGNSSQSGNDNFEFITSKAGRKEVDPIAELTHISSKRRNSAADEDEPPFNFQGMLRKTNFQRESMKKASEERRNSLKNAFQATRKFSLPKNSNDGTVENSAVLNNGRSVCMELAPGLILEGVEVDL